MAAKKADTRVLKKVELTVAQMVDKMAGKRVVMKD